MASILVIYTFVTGCTFVLYMESTKSLLHRLASLLWTNQCGMDPRVVPRVTGEQLELTNLSSWLRDQTGE